MSLLAAPRSILLITFSAVLLIARAAGAQEFDLQIGNGLVTLDARDAAIPQILERWAQLGGTTVVNGEKIPAARVTLQLVDVAERRALAILLRNVGGYILAERGDDQRGASVIGRILILPSGAPGRGSPPSSLVDAQVAGDDSAASPGLLDDTPETPFEEPVDAGRSIEDVMVPPMPSAPPVPAVPAVGISPPTRPVTGPKGATGMPGYVSPPQGNPTPPRPGGTPDAGVGGIGNGAVQPAVVPPNAFGATAGGLRPGEVTSLPPPAPLRSPSEENPPPP